MQVLVDLRALGSDLVRIDREVLSLRRDAAYVRDHSAQLGGAEIDLGAFAHAVIEVARRGREDRGAVRDAGLVAHAQRAPSDLDAGADGAEDRVERLVLELGLVHAGGGAIQVRTAELKGWPRQISPAAR